jgi:glycolate oxidase iron-sulfur subunit
MLKDYASLLGTDGAQSFSHNVFDISEFLAAYHLEDIQKMIRGFETPTRIGYQSPCHLLHGQRIASAPMDLLRLIPNAEIFPFDENDICCGSAGSYNIENPKMGEALRERKTAIIREAQPEIVATANAGCIMQLRSGLENTIPVRHVIEIIADRLHAQAAFD